jgi:adenosylhomocysteinase
VIDVPHSKPHEGRRYHRQQRHFNVEINIPGLREMFRGEPRRIRPFVEQYRLRDGRVINLLADGRLVNLAARRGAPGQRMDMSFANQALGSEYLLSEGKNLSHQVYTIPEAIDQEIARLKLESDWASRFDTLTDQQIRYLHQWQEGT